MVSLIPYKLKILYGKTLTVQKSDRQVTLSHCTEVNLNILFYYTIHLH